MAKQPGIQMSVSLADSGGTARDLSGDITDFDWAMPRDAFDVTGLNVSARERILGLADMSGTFRGPFNPTANASHDVFKTVASTNVARALVIAIGNYAAPTSGDPELTASVLLTDYPLSRANDGQLTWAVPFSLANGVAPAWGTV